MIEDHICDGDMILIERTQEARDGDIVVALVGGNETTLKRFYASRRHHRLQPAKFNAETDPGAGADVQIQGRLLAVMRKVQVTRV